MPHFDEFDQFVGAVAAQDKADPGSSGSLLISVYVPSKDLRPTIRAMEVLGSVQNSLSRGGVTTGLWDIDSAEAASFLTRWLARLSPGQQVTVAVAVIAVLAPTVVIPLQTVANVIEYNWTEGAQNDEVPDNVQNLLVQEGVLRCGDDEVDVLVRVPGTLEPGTKWTWDHEGQEVSLEITGHKAWRCPVTMPPMP